MKGMVKGEKSSTCMIDSGNSEIEKGKNVWDENKLSVPPAVEIAVFSGYENIICFLKSTPSFFSENNKTVGSKKVPYFLSIVFSKYTKKGFSLTSPSVFSYIKAMLD